MKLTQNNYESIKLKVVSLFQKYDICQVPIDCFEICSKMNIKLVPYSSLTKPAIFKSIEISNDGFCLLKSDSIQGLEINKWHIFYNDNMIKERVRFTIMHEVGHIALDHTMHSQLAESEANFFAKYSLTPPPLVHKIQPEDYTDLIDAFEISSECAFYAMNNYINWLNNGGAKYKEYELVMLSLFNQKTIWR